MFHVGRKFGHRGATSFTLIGAGSGGVEGRCSRATHLGDERKNIVPMIVMVHLMMIPM